MNDISSLATSQLGTVTIKTKTVDAPEKVKNKQGKELNKQECLVGDASGCGHLVLWEEMSVKYMKIKATKSQEHTFKGVNYLSLAPEFQIELHVIDDIGVTAEIEPDDLQDRGIVK
jgi:hypothetical protein